MKPFDLSSWPGPGRPIADVWVGQLPMFFRVHVTAPFASVDGRNGGVMSDHWWTELNGRPVSVDPATVHLTFPDGPDDFDFSPPPGQEWTWSTIDGAEGFASTMEEAMAAADARLERLGFEVVPGEVIP